MPEENYWVIIPPPVVADRKLPNGAKLVFGRVFALVSRKGYCWASNAFIAKDLGLSKGTVSDYLSKLAHAGYLRIELIRDKKNIVKERRIYTHLSNQSWIPIQNPIQLGLEKSIENSKDIRNSKGLEKMREIVDKWRKYA